MALAAWETRVRDRVRRGIKKYGKFFAEAKAAKKNEADIGGLVFMMLEEVFGYDKTSEITAEYRIRAQFADYAIKLSGKPIILIEMKGAAVRLTQNHLLQVSAYAMQLGIEWVVLCNGLVWQLFHISRTTPLEEDTVFECDLLGGAKQDTVEKLCALTREYVIRGEPRKTYEKAEAVRPQNLLRCLYSEPVLTEMRRCLKANTGYKADIDELRDLVERHLLRPELVGKVKPFKPRARLPRPKQTGAPQTS
jgi:Type I restriction enzyme R protein N terminus (HSDR_N)